VAIKLKKLADQVKLNTTFATLASGLADRMVVKQVDKMHDTEPPGGHYTSRAR
jgi:hypothetical protein